MRTTGYFVLVLLAAVIHASQGEHEKHVELGGHKHDHTQGEADEAIARYGKRSASWGGSSGGYGGGSSGGFGGSFSEGHG